ncbi:hypothetical protein [Amphritea sp.]|uniref:hypothetical protein n=1 Tax=Amphritea sp. TaxID=1872502 RepID=UPI003A904AE2
MGDKKGKGFQLHIGDPNDPNDSDDHDIALIKVLTGSLDLSDFNDLEESLHFLDNTRSSWHLLPALNQLDAFQDYCEYIKTEASKLISKQTKARQGSLLSYPTFIQDEPRKKIIINDIFERYLYAKTPALHKHLNESKGNEYPKARNQFLRWLGDENSEVMNVDVVVNEAAIFAEEWMSTVVLLHKKNNFSKLAHPLASRSIKPYDFAVSYVFYEIEPLLASEKTQLSSKDIFKLVFLYWVVSLAKANKLLENKEKWEVEAKQELVESKIKLQTFDDFILSKVRKGDKGAQLKQYRTFMRNVVIKAWIHLQTRDNPKPQYSLAADLEIVLGKYNLKMERSTIISLVNDLFQPDYLLEHMPYDLLSADNIRLKSYIDESFLPRN